jgi:chromate transporter
MTVFHVRLVPLLLVLSPLAMAWYWPRQAEEGNGP